jgi:hypothetical protein
MTAAAVLPSPAQNPPRSAATAVPATPTVPGTPSTAAVAYQRVLHQLARRELRLLAELAAWAPADDAARTADLTAHGHLLVRVLLHHHAAERDLLWPALLRSVPAAEREAARHYVSDCTARADALDAQLRALGTAARQWSVSASAPAREAFVKACARLADDVAAQTEAEEMTLLPLLGRHLAHSDWRRIADAVTTPFDGREQMLVLGLALEDACALDRARVLAGLSPAVRTAWRIVGRREHRAAVVRLRGAPPAL